MNGLGASMLLQQGTKSHSDTRTHSEFVLCLTDGRQSDNRYSSCCVADRRDTDGHTDTVHAVWLLDETLIVTLIQFMLCG